MKKNYLIRRMMFCVFILSFASCNEDFDFTDEKTDKNTVLGDSLSLPVGVVQFNIYSQLLKSYDSLKFRDSDDVIYVEYPGTIPVEFPQFEIPEIEKASTGPVLGSSFKQVGVNTSLPFVVQNYPVVVQDIPIDLNLKKPELETGDIKFYPEEIGFRDFVMEVWFKYGNVDPKGPDPQIVIVLSFPDNFDIEGLEATDDGIISIDTIRFGDMTANEYHFRDVLINSYKFENSEPVKCNIVLLGANGTRVENNSWISLDVKVKEGDPNPPKLSYLRGALNGESTFSESAGDFSGLRTAFEDMGSFGFRDLSLELSMTYNLSADFKLDFRLEKKDVNGEETDAVLDPAEVFEKSPDGSTKTETVTLNSDKIKKLDDVVSTPIPDKLDYVATVKFDSAQVTLFNPDRMELSADYTFHIPFDFKNIDLQMNDTVRNLFGESVYTDVFKHLDDIAIEADVINTVSGMDIEIVSNILDENNQPVIDEDIHTDRFSIKITGDDLEKMRSARHLAFRFRLRGSGVIKQTDRIGVKNLRIVSSNGIRYEF